MKECIGLIADLIDGADKETAHQLAKMGTVVLSIG